jgi:hypothetical protein
MAVSNDCGTVCRAVLASVAIAIAAPVLAQDVKEGSPSQSSDGQDATPTSAQVDLHPSKYSSTRPSAMRSSITDGHLALGAGMTYQYHGSKGTTLGLVTWSSREDHYAGLKKPNKGEDFLTLAYVF